MSGDLVRRIADDVQLPEGVRLEPETMSLTISAAFTGDAHQQRRGYAGVGLALAAAANGADRLHGLFQLALGDWFDQGETRAPLAYTQGHWDVEQVLARKTLLNYASVARRVSPKVRNPALTYRHHELVAPLADTPHAQEHWLGRAAENGWSVAEMREVMVPTGGKIPTRSERIAAAVHTLWITSKKGPIEADEEQYAVDGEFLRTLAQLNGDLPSDGNTQGRPVAELTNGEPGGDVAQVIDRIAREGMRFNSKTATSGLTWEDACYLIPASELDDLLRAHGHGEVIAESEEEEEFE